MAGPLKMMHYGETLTFYKITSLCSWWHTHSTHQSPVSPSDEAVQVRRSADWSPSPPDTKPQRTRVWTTPWPFHYEGGQEQVKYTCWVYFVNKCAQQLALAWWHSAKDSTPSCSEGRPTVWMHLIISIWNIISKRVEIVCFFLYQSLMLRRVPGTS